MENEYRRLMQAASVQIPAELEERVYRSLRAYRARSERMRLVWSSFAGVLAAAGLTFAIPALASAASASGFVNYLALFLSDSDLAFSHAGLFLLPVLEALPGPEATLTLFLLATLLVAGRNVIRSMAAPQAREHLLSNPTH